MADPVYEQEFRKELQKEGMVARGPFLDIGGSFETRRTLRELIQDNCVSPLFQSLEPIAEEKRELKLDRPLYRHQETSLLKAAAGENLVVTTGTGSGKTESFLLPIINHLLKEQESGTLTAGVRAIIIYPMNALANMKTGRYGSLCTQRLSFSNMPYTLCTPYNGQRAHPEEKNERRQRISRL